MASSASFVLIFVYIDTASAVKSFAFGGNCSVSKRAFSTKESLKYEGWTFANYQWNSEQTEATFTTDEHELDVDWIENGESKNVRYRIPSFAECFTCHNKYDVPLPIGPKPQNLNRSF